MPSQAINQFVLKTSYEIIFLAVVILSINRIKKFEDSYVTDTNVNYNILNLALI